MNKKIYLLLISMILLFPIKGYALDNASITCDKTKLNKNEETTCQIITGNLDYEIASFQGKITLGDNLSLVSSSYDSNKWMYFGSNFSVTDIEFATKNSYLLANNLSIATFKIKASNNASGASKISLTNINVSDKNYSSKTLTCNPLNISFSSNVNTLNDLNVKEQQINFNKDTSTYSFNTSLDFITISATPTDSNAKVSGTGKINLKYGINEIKIEVTAEDGTKREYKINVTRTDNRSSNNNLKKISLSKGKINFTETKTTYSVDVESKIDAITITAELADSKASFVKGYEPRKVNLKYGTNKVLLKVKSENNQEKVYTININRKDDRSNNNFLKKIELSAGKIKFNRDILEYKLNVPYETQSFNINALAEDEKSIIEIVGEKELLLGENIFVIKVTSENEETKEYKIIVTREEKVEITSSNKLKNIEIDDYKINFNPNEYYYIVKTNKNKLNIKVTLQDENATYKINGNNDLKDGSVISIIITDKDGNNNIYKLMIVKNTNPIIYILITLLLIILSVYITIFVMKNKKSGNKRHTTNKDSENNITKTYNTNEQFMDNNTESMNNFSEENNIIVSNLNAFNELISVLSDDKEQINNEVNDNGILNQSTNKSFMYNNYSETVETPKLKEEKTNNANSFILSQLESKKYCKNCNRLISNNSSACPWCGTINN